MKSYEKGQMKTNRRQQKATKIILLFRIKLMWRKMEKTARTRRRTTVATSHTHTLTKREMHGSGDEFNRMRRLSMRSPYISSFWTQKKKKKIENGCTQHCVGTETCWPTNTAIYAIDPLFRLQIFRHSATNAECSPTISAQQTQQK